MGDALSSPCSLVIVRAPVRQIPHQRQQARVSLVPARVFPPEPLALSIQPKETDHGRQEDREESRQEGEDQREGQGAAEGESPVNYTLTQAIDRAKDLSGLLKAARAHEVDCAADHSAKLRIAEIAAEAHEKATAHCIALEAEREQLADHIAALVRKVGEPLELPEPASPFWHGATIEGADFQAQALQNGMDRIGEAFNEATR